MAVYNHTEEELKRLNENLEQVVTERTREIQEAYDELKQAQAQLLQSEKLASIGQLAAGVAHEINNPMSFIISNFSTLQEYVQDLSSLLQSYSALEEQLNEGDADQTRALRDEIARQKQEIDLQYILEDLNNLISESSEGAERVRKIVQDLKEFSHVDQEEKMPTDLNKGLESTLNIVWNELKYKVTVDKDLGEIPEVMGYPMELNQVFMNLFVNAGQAIEDQGTISIRTCQEDGYACVIISDTGTGMPPEVAKKIFEPFFTTKEVGKGTGLGLSMAYNIVQKHDGEILVDSQEGVGTTFTIKIPLG
jgi:two-component system, NtrC family, sensor kinase